jgi:hypothetical protein
MVHPPLRNVERGRMPLSSLNIHSYLSSIDREGAFVRRPGEYLEVVQRSRPTLLIAVEEKIEPIFARDRESRAR